MGFISGFPAHVRLDDSRSLAGIGELSQTPHHLDEVVARVLVEGAAGVRPADILTPVRPLGPLTGQLQLGVLPLSRDDHGAQVLCFGVELNGVFPDVLPPVVLSLGRPKEVTGEKQQKKGAGLGPHVVTPS